MLNSFLDKISHFINSNSLLNSNAKYLVALSGGADSVALMLSLRKLGYAVSAVHCNFHLRGEESDRDEMFCEKLCRDQNVTFHRAHFDTKEYAKLHHVSIEMAARELRYNYFSQLTQELGYEGVCVAHHKDDNAETILLNVLRGTGLKGLCGMQPKNGKVLRPFLCVSRDEIVNFLHFIEQDYVVDSSNLLADVKRNKLRLEVFPQLKDINPAFVDSLLQMAENVKNARKMLDETVENERRKALIEQSEHHVVYSLEVLRRHEYLLYAILSYYGFNAAQIEQIYNRLDAQPGTEWESEDNVALIDRNTLYIYTRACIPNKTLVIPIVGRYVYSDTISFRIEVSDMTPEFCFSTDRLVATLDADKVSFPLTIRPVIKGDRFIPLGMRGKRLVSDFLTDRKASLYHKRRQLVVTDANGNIIWLAGERLDERCKVVDSTVRILTVSLLRG